MKNILVRISKVLCRDENVVYEIAWDKKATLPAFGLVLLAGLFGGIRWVLENEYQLELTISLLIGTIVAWLVFAESIQFAEMLWVGGGMDRAELLRLSGFSALPLACFSIPYMGWLGLVWFWIVTYTAIRNFYSTKPKHTAVLIGLGSLTAFTTWGITIVVVKTALTGG